MVAPAGRWRPEDSERLYRVAEWGRGYFSVDPGGSLTVHPRPGSEAKIDLNAVVRELEDAGIAPPLVVRFPEVLADSVRRIDDAFSRAMIENRYRGGHVPVYPVEVDQRRSVLEDIRRLDGEHRCGFQVGSRAELLAVLACTCGERGGRLILCNGRKDRAYLQTVLLAGKLGRDVITVLESPADVPRLAREARLHGVEPRLGVRVRPTGDGDAWAGVSAPGMSIPELLRACDLLAEHDLLEALCLVRCHAGGRARHPARVRAAAAELAHVHVELVRRGAAIEFLDVGGGLGVQGSDGAPPELHSSADSTLREHASEIVYRIASVCDGAGIGHPRIVSEPGRALAAHHAVIVFEALAVSGPAALPVGSVLPPPEDVEQPVWDLFEAYTLLDGGRPEECRHDAVDAYRRAIELFRLGYLPLPQRALAERLFRAVTARMADERRASDCLAEEPGPAADLPGDMYLCNLSVFRSLPDSWARNGLFPVMPIHRLDERPTRKGVLADVTCDSDGTVDRFAEARSICRTLDLHPLRMGEPYRLAAFLVGAYQRTLGDLHNLFGETTTAAVRSLPEGGWRIDGIEPGESAAEVLARVEYDGSDLLGRMIADCRRATADGTLTEPQGRAAARTYARFLEGPTYLSADDDDPRLRSTPVARSKPAARASSPGPVDHQPST